MCSKLTRAARNLPQVLLAVIALALAAGGILHPAGAGAGAAGDAAWLGDDPLPLAASSRAAAQPR